MSLRTLSPVLGLFLAACATTTPPPSAPPPAPAVVAPPPVASPPVATIDGAKVTRAELDAHVAETKLEPAAALDDLVDLHLLRTACSGAGIALSKTPSPADRAKAELELARKLSLDVPPGGDVLVVDHAWVKDAKKKATTAKQKKSLEDLRALVVAGQTIPKAFETLPGIDGNAWHIGDHEEYPYGVVPDGAHDLKPGGLSPVIPGDGGLHLFQIYARKQTPPPADAVHQLVRDSLRSGKAIEIVEASSP